MISPRMVGPERVLWVNTISATSQRRNGIISPILTGREMAKLTQNTSFRAFFLISIAFLYMSVSVSDLAAGVEPSFASDLRPSVLNPRCSRHFSALALLFLVGLQILSSRLQSLQAPCKLRASPFNRFSESLQGLSVPLR